MKCLELVWFFTNVSSVWGLEIKYLCSVVMFFWLTVFERKWIEIRLLPVRLTQLHSDCYFRLEAWALQLTQHMYNTLVRCIKNNVEAKFLPQGVRVTNIRHQLALYHFVSDIFFYIVTFNINQDNTVFSFLFFLG